MSLPMTAVGPEKVETKPILIGFWALAAPTENANAAALTSRVLRMVSLPESFSASRCFACALCRRRQILTARCNLIGIIAPGKRDFAPGRSAFRLGLPGQGRFRALARS